MARIKINPEIRFADCKNILDYVKMRGGRGEIDCLSHNAAVNMQQRLNHYRKIVRENNDGLTLLDIYVTRLQKTLSAGKRLNTNGNGDNMTHNPQYSLLMIPIHSCRISR